MTPDAPIFRPVAERAVLVEFGTAINDAAHAAVLRLDLALAAHPCPGFCESVPAFVNLLVVFDPLVTGHALVEAHLRALLSVPGTAHPAPVTHQVLVCYDADLTPDLAPDLAAVAARTGLSVEAVINAHLAGRYHVAMYGFAPGYAYLAGVPDAIRVDRKPAPVRGVAAGSVIIAGPQCLITTLTMPTGWWVIGRSPTAILTGDPDHPFLFGVGDEVRFCRVSRSAYEALR